MMFGMCQFWISNKHSVTNRRVCSYKGLTGKKPAGQIKDTRGFDRFLQRGIEACRGERSLVCASYNLLELIKRPFFFILTCNFA